MRYFEMSELTNSVSQTSRTTITTMADTYNIPINRLVRSTGCGLTSPVRPGTSADITLHVNPAVSEGRYTRTYRVHVPMLYSSNHAIAVVLVYHGASGTAATMECDSGFSTLANQQGFLVVYPQGLPNGMNGKPFWASVGPIDYGIDDVLFTSNILDSLQRTFCVDPERIYSTGFSNGGGMTGFLACRLYGRIAAFAPISGNFYNPPGGCNPERPVSILSFHGTANPILPYNGILTSENPAWPLPSIPQWLLWWAMHDSCTVGPVMFYDVLPVVGERWTNCRDNVSVVHYRIEGGGHAEPPTINHQSSAALIWHFFQPYTLPRFG